MLSIKMSRKIVKSILLSTTLLVSGVILGHNAPLASDFPLDHEKQLQPTRLQEALKQYLEIKKDAVKYTSEGNEQYTLEEKKVWILNALNVLKNLTDYARLMKYSILLQASSTITTVNFSVKGWDREKEIFNSESFKFYLQTPTFKGKILYKDISGDEVVNIIKLLDLRLSRKYIFVNSFMTKNRSKNLSNVYNKVLSEAFEDGKLKSDRGEMLYAIFGANGEKIAEKNKLVKLLQTDIKSVDEDVIKNNKIKFYYESNVNIDKIKKVKSKVEATWEHYLEGEKLLLRNMNNDKMRQLVLVNLKTKTLELNLKDIDDKDLFTFYLYLQYRVLSLMNVSHFVYPKNVDQINPISKAFAEEELAMDRVILIRGEVINNDSNKFSLGEKQSWILEACALLKKYEDFSEELLYGPFNLKPHTYSSWDNTKGAFLLESLRIGTSFEKDDTPVFSPLMSLEEWFVDQTIMPKLLYLTLEKYLENVLWEQVKKPQYDPQDSKYDDKPISDYIFDIYNVFDRNNRSSVIKRQLFLGYVQKNIFIKVNLKSEHIHQNDISEIKLEKSQSKDWLDCKKILRELCEDGPEYKGYIEELRKLDRDPLNTEDKNPENVKYQQALINFVEMIKTKHKTEDIYQVHKIVMYQQELFNQYYNLINLELSKDSPLLIPLEQTSGKDLNGGLSEQKKKIETPKIERKEETTLLFLTHNMSEKQKMRERLNQKRNKIHMTNLVVESEKIVEASIGHEAKDKITTNKLPLSEEERKVIEEDLTAKSQNSSKKSSRKHVAMPKHALPKDTNKQKAKMLPAKTVSQTRSAEKTEDLQPTTHEGRSAVIVQGFPMPKTEPKKPVVMLEKQKTSQQIVPQNTYVPQPKSPIKEIKSAELVKVVSQNTVVSQNQSPIKEAKTENVKQILSRNSLVSENERPQDQRTQNQLAKIQSSPLRKAQKYQKYIYSPKKQPSLEMPPINIDQSWSEVVQSVDQSISPLSIVPQIVQNQETMEHQLINNTQNHNINYISRSLRSDVHSYYIDCLKQDKNASNIVLPPLVYILEKEAFNKADILRLQISPNPSDAESNLFRTPLKVSFNIYARSIDDDKGIESNGQIEGESDGNFDNQQNTMTYLNISLETNHTQYLFDQSKFFMDETKSKLQSLVREFNATDLKGADKIVVEIFPDVSHLNLAEALSLDSWPKSGKIIHWLGKEVRK